MKCNNNLALNNNSQACIFNLCLTIVIFNKKLSIMKYGKESLLDKILFVWKFIPFRIVFLLGVAFGLTGSVSEFDAPEYFRYIGWGVHVLNGLAVIFDIIMAFIKCKKED